MGRTLTFERTEHLREYYFISWTEDDYKRFLERLSERTNEDERAHMAYNILKNLSFDDVCDICTGRKKDINYEVSYPSISKNSFTYTESISVYIKAHLREEAWDCGPYDSNCDDYDEDIDISDD